jgi:hypothetical protein
MFSTGWGTLKLVDANVPHLFTAHTRIDQLGNPLQSSSVADPNFENRTNGIVDQESDQRSLFNGFGKPCPIDLLQPAQPAHGNHTLNGFPSHSDARENTSFSQSCGTLK